MSLITIAKLYNIITAKLQFAPYALSLSNICECPDLSGESQVRIRDAVKSLHKKGLVRRVPISVLGGRDRVGYEWIKTGMKDGEILVGPAVTLAKPVEVQQDIRIKVNADHSVTIITRSIRITVEVPL